MFGKICLKEFMMDCSREPGIKTGAIIILYNPDMHMLLEGLRVLGSSVDVVCLVDNSSTDNTACFQGLEHVLYVPLMQNLGIAAAQNVGLRHLAGLGAEYVVFSDQDSLADSLTVGRLLKAYLLLAAIGNKVGGVGTRAINVETGVPYKSKSKEYERLKVGKAEDMMVVTRCSYIRSSISLMRLSTFKEIGGYDESLFIDGVDNEWCWRAGTSGYRFYIVENAVISHHLGEGDRKIAARSVAISSTFRIFFQYRNYLWLCRRSYVPRWWKCRHLLKYAAKMIYYPLFVKPKWEYSKRIALGIYEGLKGNGVVGHYEL